MMAVEELKWLSQEAEEAILKISDNFYSCEEFCHPCKYKKGDVIINPLLSLEEQDLVRVKTQAIGIEKNNSKTSLQRILAQVIDIGLITVGTIQIELSLPLPGDIKKEKKFYFLHLD